MNPANSVNSLLIFAPLLCPTHRLTVHIKCKSQCVFIRCIYIIKCVLAYGMAILVQGAFWSLTLTNPMRIRPCPPYTWAICNKMSLTRAKLWCNCVCSDLYKVSNRNRWSQDQPVQAMFILFVKIYCKIIL